MSQLTPKENYWLNHLKGWRRSGQSINAYTRQHKLTPSGFYAWRKRLAAHLDEHETPAHASLFVPVELDDGNLHQQALLIHLPNGCRIELPCQHIELLEHIMSLNNAR